MEPVTDWAIAPGGKPQVSSQPAPTNSGNMDMRPGRGNLNIILELRDSFMDSTLSQGSVNDISKVARDVNEFGRLSGGSATRHVL
jgi:hypothetical protein